MPASDLTNGVLTNLSSLIMAVGGLGTAAFGLVDTSKAFGGGISRVGFKSIRAALDKLFGAPGAAGAAAPTSLTATLQANWINGVAKADQKATAKSLIRLALTPDNAARLGANVGVDGDALKPVAAKLKNGEALSAPELLVVGRFDAAISALLDEAYERGDQQYRNTSKLCAAVLALLLAVVGGWIIYLSDGATNAWAYFTTRQFSLALLIGAIATPLAPIAKDVSSAIGTAVSAVSAWRR